MNLKALFDDPDLLHYLNIVLAVYWPAFIALALRTGTIRLGTFVPRVARERQPRTYWMILAFLAAITLVLWFLVARWLIVRLQP